ncbi:MAG: hypothetical protein R2912_10935 [Eubacteriales bacterium]
MTRPTEPCSTSIDIGGRIDSTPAVFQQPARRGYRGKGSSSKRRSSA